MYNNQKLSIFLVDDDAIYLTLLQNVLSKNQSYVIETFANGELCLKRISAEPDVIVLDYHLSGIEKKSVNGLDALRKIKLINSDIAVIMLSLQDDIEVAVSCMNFNSVDYIVKSETALVRLNYSIQNLVHYKKMENIMSWYTERLQSLNIKV